MWSDGPADPPKGPQPGVTSRSFHVIDITTPVLSQLTVTFRVRISGTGYTKRKKRADGAGPEAIHHVGRFYWPQKSINSNITGN
ncbi:hypothetical protein BHE74_00027755 [Ensete ventricosum]|nr:hypothetical protein BHE74_00027755 [Ensete ventricosum]RZR82969.1 hypothetical protein BHM03_00009502 [Ensete ventricosum]